MSQRRLTVSCDWSALEIAAFLVISLARRVISQHFSHPIKIKLYSFHKYRVFDRKKSVAPAISYSYG